MRVLLLSPLVKFSGNFETVKRIKYELEKNKIVCFLENALDIANQTALEGILEKSNIDIVIGVHVFKSGKLLAGITKPYMIILGGTDVNEFSKDGEKMAVMTKAIHKSRHVVAFSQSLAEKFKICWPTYDKQKVSIIPQGVKVCSSDFSIKAYLEKNMLNGTEMKGDGHCSYVYGCDLESFLSCLEKAEARVFTIVGGIRPVKNPLFLMKTFSDWRCNTERKNCWLLFIGANQNDEFFDRFRAELYSCPGIVYIPGLSVENTHTVIRDSFALVNSSDSEGMALAILEAMALSTPVIARNIPGNMAVVEDGQTGFIYDSPGKFIEKAESLLENPQLVETVCNNASTYIRQHHSMENEEKAYVALVNKYC